MTLRWWRPAVWLAVFGLAGCASPQFRPQSDEEGDRAEKPGQVRTIGDVTEVANAASVVVSGVGLVVDLDGTGGAAPPGAARQVLEDRLRKRGVEDVKGVLNSTDAALVLVQAVIPAGARKGDPVDIDVRLPENSKATSLRGGRLIECTLHNYARASELSEDVAQGQRPDRFLQGHPLVKAEGRLLVGLDDGRGTSPDPDGPRSLKAGRVWGGGKCMIDRPLFLVLNPDQQRARVAARVADRVNEAFGAREGGDTLAAAQSKERVTLGVPARYRQNLSRYLRVVRLIPLDESPASDSQYRRKLEEQLLDPAQTLFAALRLEALGSDSVPALKAGLESEMPSVRFAAAEALAYLGEPAGGQELAKLAKEKSHLQAFCLTALAAMDRPVSHVKLAELLESPTPEVRYGAFRALRVLDESAPVVTGEKLGEAFWLHRAPVRGPALIHLLTVRRAEVVLFGEGEHAFKPPFYLQAGPEFLVTASPGDRSCTVARFGVGRSAERVPCGLSVAEVLEKVVSLGGGYPEAVELLREADREGSLSCPLRMNAFPQAASVYELARMGKEDPRMEGRPASGSPADDPLGVAATPTLFQK